MSRSPVEFPRTLFDDILEIFLTAHESDLQETARRNATKCPRRGFVIDVLRRVYLGGENPQDFENLNVIPELIGSFGRELAFVNAQLSQEMVQQNGVQASRALWIREKINQEAIKLQGLNDAFMKERVGTARLANVNPEYAGGTSDRGRRDKNEDCKWFACEEFQGNRDSLLHDIMQRTTRLAVKMLQEVTIRGHHAYERTQAGSTFTLATVQNGVLTTAQSGDGCVIKLVKKHGKWTCVNCVPEHNGERRTIAESNWLSSELLRSRVGASDKGRWQEYPELAVARSLGDKFYYGDGFRPYPSFTQIDLDSAGPDAATIEREIIITGCDGLTDVLSPQDFIDIVTQWDKSEHKGDFEKLSTILCNYAFSYGSEDNLTAVCMDARHGSTAIVLDGHGGSECSQRAQRILRKEGFFKSQSLATAAAVSEGVAAGPAGPVRDDMVTIQLPDKFAAKEVTEMFAEFVSPPLPERSEMAREETASCWDGLSYLFGGAGSKGPDVGDETKALLGLEEDESCCCL
jgi:serine/threonine protein phosphatase PrpC